MKSFREVTLARKVKWAQEEHLNARAIDYAGKYVNLTTGALKIISDYENAVDLPAGDHREHMMRQAWAETIRYIRTLSVSDQAA